MKPVSVRQPADLTAFKKKEKKFVVVSGFDIARCSAPVMFVETT
jgi:hypothetical protein